MLKHATINRTTKAQQSLKLQQQLFEQRLSHESSQNQHLDEVDGVQISPTNYDKSVSFDARSQTPNSCTGPSLCNSPSPSFTSSCNGSANGTLWDRNRKESPVIVEGKILETTGSAPASLLNSPCKSASLISATSRSYSGVRPVRNDSLIRSDNIIKVYAQSLSQEVEYVTLRVDTQTRCQQIVKSLLRKFRLKHRDPNLFYLTLERWIRKDGLKFKSVMLLGDEACPLQLQQCCSNPPHNDIKFTLQNRTGALIRIYCSDVAPNTRYKCLSLSPHTTVSETMELMLHCLDLIPQNKQHQAQNSSYVSNSVVDVSGNTSISQDGCCVEVMTQTSGIGDSLLDKNAIIQQRDHAIDRVRELTNQSPNSTGSVETNSSSSSSSTSSSVAHGSIDTSSTSSGIESESTLATSNLATTNDDKSSRYPNSQDSSLSDCDLLINKSSRTSSITSISSVTEHSTSYSDQYCLLIDGLVEGNYRHQVLDPNEYLVDIYQNSSGSDEQSPSENQVKNNAHSRPEQTFKFIMKKRAQLVTIDPSSSTTVNTMSISRQNMPLPAIPVSYPVGPIRVNHNQNKYTRVQQSAHNIVSTTQIEVNTPRTNGFHSQSQSVIVPRTYAFSGYRSGSGRFNPKPSTNINTARHNNIHDYNNNNNNNHDKPATCTTNTDLLPDVCASAQLTAREDVANPMHNSNTDSERLPPPPKFIYLAPPIRPRRRNLSNASSTFGRPPPSTTTIIDTTTTMSASCATTPASSTNMIMANRRRYTPAQLADDLNKLDVSAGNQCDVGDSTDHGTGSDQSSETKPNESDTQTNIEGSLASSENCSTAESGPSLLMTVDTPDS